LKKILLIEDNKDLSAIIKFNLIKNDYEVFDVENANDGLMILDDIEINLILLDLMLPGFSGLEFLKIIKKNKNFINIPVIIISAKTLEDDIIEGLKLGADDYVPKPFSINVLIAKIEAILRRSHLNIEDTLSFKGIEFERATYRIKVDGEDVNLTKKEVDLLVIFLENKEKVLSRDVLLNKVWGYTSDVYTRTVDAHISSLRKKLGKKGKLIKSIPKIGYVLK
jgi:DNA-binding response OmpR family regulator